MGTSAPPETAAAVCHRVLAHLLTRIQLAEVWDEPFGHTYIEDAFPADVYATLLATLPPVERYQAGPHGPHTRPGTRLTFNLTAATVRRFPVDRRNLWTGVAAALTEPELKRCLYAKLAPDLIHRFGVPADRVADLPGYARPTLYRDGDGFELPPHPDTLKKVVTMHLYLPADLSQLHLGTAVYRRVEHTPTGDRRDGFRVVKTLEFRPNSGYAFVVNDTATRQSWHGREPLPPGSGVRNSLLNTFYADPRAEYEGYMAGADGGGSA
jgi:hypothetical protein